MLKIDRCVAIVLTTPDGHVILQERDDSPAIAFPGYWSLFGGCPEVAETPFDGMIRELSEEIVLANGGNVEVDSVSFLGTNERAGLDRTEYIFHVELASPPELLRAIEGKGVGVFTLQECLTLERFAPHHREYLRRYYDAVIASQKNRRTRTKRHAMNDNKLKLDSYIDVVTLSAEKDLEGLENGRGSVDIEGDSMSVLIPPESPAEFIAYIEFPADTPKGYHYHKRKVEYMIVLKGQLHARLELLNDGDPETKEIVIQAGQILRVLPGCVHTLTALGEKVIAIEYSPQKYSSADVTKVPGPKPKPTIDTR